jgi:hypothetical protein
MNRNNPVKGCAIAALFFLHAFIISSEKASSQDVQTWVDGFVVKPLGYFEYEGNLGTARLLQTNGWRDFYLCNTMSYQRATWYLAEGSAELHLTKDPLAQDITEVRIFLAQKFFFASYMEKIHLQLPYFYMRLEDRFMSYHDDGTTEQKLRLRARLGGRFLINNIFIDKNTWYIPFSAEYFFNFNGEALERYAASNRFMIGVGHAFTQRWRGELNYYAQRSRNTNEDSFEKTDMMFQLAIRYHILKATE